MDIEQLISERGFVIDDLSEMQARMAALQSRLSTIDQVLSGLRQLGMTDFEVGGLPFPVPMNSIGVPTPDEFMNAPSHDDDDDDPDQLFGRRPAVRIRSTAIVADIVNSHGQPLTRDEIYELFGANPGFPPGWSNPRNALNNALMRAWENGWIDRLDQDVFAPQGKGFRPDGGRDG